MISAFKRPFFKNKNHLDLLVGKCDGWLSFALHIGVEACELHFCTMRLYCKHIFNYRKLTGSKIRASVFFIVMLEHFVGNEFL